MSMSTDRRTPDVGPPPLRPFKPCMPQDAYRTRDYPEPRDVSDPTAWNALRARWSGGRMSAHAAILMARRRVPSQLPRQLVWPYDCTRRCNEMVHVATGSSVADEMTRGLRAPYKALVRGQYTEVGREA